LIEQGVRFKAVDVSAFPAIEIDTPEDLRAAEALVMTQHDPSIDS
jgi:choline kinase